MERRNAVAAATAASLTLLFGAAGLTANATILGAREADGIGTISPVPDRAATATAKAGTGTTRPVATTTPPGAVPGAGPASNPSSGPGTADSAAAAPAADVPVASAPSASPSPAPSAPVAHAPAPVATTAPPATATGGSPVATGTEEGEEHESVGETEEHEHEEHEGTEHEGGEDDD